jgi:hypothetical protein
MNETMNSMSIPPFASYEGTDVINGQDCTVWSADFFGYAQFTYYVANVTNIDGKMIPECIRFIASILSKINTTNGKNLQI